MREMVNGYGAPKRSCKTWAPLWCLTASLVDLKLFTTVRTNPTHVTHPPGTGSADSLDASQGQGHEDAGSEDSLEEPTARGQHETREDHGEENGEEEKGENEEIEDETTDETQGVKDAIKAENNANLKGVLNSGKLQENDLGNCEEKTNRTAHASVLPEADCKPEVRNGGEDKEPEVRDKAEVEETQEVRHEPEVQEPEVSHKREPRIEEDWDGEEEEGDTQSPLTASSVTSISSEDSLQQQSSAGSNTGSNNSNNVKVSVRNSASWVTYKVN